MTWTGAGCKKTLARRPFVVVGVFMPLPSCRTICTLCSSYPGYAHRARRFEWVAYDDLLASWTGAFGGSDPAGVNRRYVTAGLSEPPESPWKEARHGWVLGSEASIDRVKAMVHGEPRRERRR
jgi:hypothetical protein